jgi:defect-in-organelle-trafficking protein DotC
MSTLLVGFFAFHATGSAAAGTDPAQPAAPPPTLDQLLSSSSNSVVPDGISPIRFDAIRDTAISFGAQAGLAHRAMEINQTLDQVAKHYDAVFNFEALMLEGGVIPPVLIETKNNYEQVSDDFIKTGDLYYEIYQQPRFSWSAPNWRSYLYMTQFAFDKDKLAHIDFRDSKELDLWKQYVSTGYAQGEKQADAMLEQNRRRLTRDIEGMALYYKLLAQGRVSRPMIVGSNLGVTGDPKKSMTVGEVIYRITVKPEFVTNHDKWSDKPGGDLGERLERAPNVGNHEPGSRDAGMRDPYLDGPRESASVFADPSLSSNSTRAAQATPRGQ